MRGSSTADLSLFGELARTAGAITVDGAIGSVFNVNGAVGNQTVIIQNVRPGQRVFLIFIQDATGGRTLTVDGATVQTATFSQLDASYRPNLVPLACTVYLIVGMTSTTVAIAAMAPNVQNVQNGTGTLIAGSATINAKLTSLSRITATMKDPGAGVITLMAGLNCPAGLRDTAAGTFVVQAIGDDKVVIATAVCTFDWKVEG